MGGWRRAAAALLLSCIGAPACLAGGYGEDLVACLTRSSAGSDEATLVRWAFVAVAQHPAVKALAAIDEGELDAIDEKMGELFQRLALHDCRRQTSEALQHEGIDGLRHGLTILGGAAIGALIGDGAVAAHLNDVFAPTEIEIDKWTALLAEAGIARPF